MRRLLNHCVTFLLGLPINVLWCGANAVEGSTENLELDSVYGEPVNRTYVRGCYFTNWAKYRRGRAKYFPEDYLPGLCTHIFFAFGWMSEEFEIKAYDQSDLDLWETGQYRRVNSLKEHDPQLKTLISVGGWTFGTRLFKSMSATAERRATFINSTIAFCRLHDFDGLDVDWEYPDNDLDKQNFNLFVKETRLAYEAEANETGSERLLITAAVSAGDDKIAAGYDIAELAKWFDFVNVMTYDFHGTWEMVTGMNSPLFGRPGEDDQFLNWNVDSASRIWADGGMPREKIIIGLAAYGRGWTIAENGDDGVGIPATGKANRGQFTGEPGIAAWYEICEMLAAGAKSVWHAEHKVPYLVHGNQWFSYDDQRSIRNKMRWLKWHGYGGAFVWTLDFDDFNGGCSDNAEGVEYPLIRIMADELADIQEFSTLPPYTTTTRAPPTHPPLPTHPWQTTTAKLPAATLPPVSTDCRKAGDGFHAHPSSDHDPSAYCSTFIVCHDGRLYGRMDCPPGMDFSQSAGHCLPRSLADCRPTTTSTTTTATTTTSTITTTVKALLTAGTTLSPGAAFDCAGKDGFFADSTDCSSFIRCNHNKAHRFTCPGSLHFEPVTKLCIDASVSQCVGPGKRQTNNNELFVSWQQ